MKIETPILRRLGPVPFWRGEQKCLEVLEPIYRRAIEAARARIQSCRSGEDFGKMLSSGVCERERVGR